MYKAFSTVLDNLIVYPARSLAEVNADYSTMTEVADMLLRDCDVPFRIGHHFASELTTYGRSHNLVPKDIPYQEAVRIYKDVTGETLPLTRGAAAARLRSDLHRAEPPRPGRLAAGRGEAHARGRAEAAGGRRSSG